MDKETRIKINILIAVGILLLFFAIPMLYLQASFQDIVLKWDIHNMFIITQGQLSIDRNQQYYYIDTLTLQKDTPIWLYTPNIENCHYAGITPSLLVLGHTYIVAKCTKYPECLWQDWHGGYILRDMNVE